VQHRCSKEKSHAARREVIETMTEGVRDEIKILNIEATKILSGGSN